MSSDGVWKEFVHDKTNHGAGNSQNWTDILDDESIDTQDFNADENWVDNVEENETEEVSEEDNDESLENTDDELKDPSEFTGDDDPNSF